VELLMLTDPELDVVNAISEAWNLFLQLPVEHDDDIEEFRRLIHAAHAKVLCRPARRSLKQ
jgi:hypothetical protein